MRGGLVSWLSKTLHLSRNRDRERDASLRTTLSSIGDAVISTDGEGRVVFMNPVAEKLTGWTQNEATGQPLEAVFRIVNEETRQPVENPVQKVLAEGSIVGLANHTMLIAKDGSEVSIDDSAAPIRDDDGKLSGVVLVFRDISQLRKAERVIAEAREYAESVVDTVRDPLLVLDADLRVRSASRSFYQDFEVTPEETEGRLIYDLGNGQWDIPKLRELLEEILPQSTVFNDFEMEHEFPSIGRKTMLLNARRLRQEGDRRESILLAIEDITDRRKAERAIAEARAFAESLVDTVRDPLLVLDADLRVRSASRSFYRSFQVTPEETTGRLVYELGNGQWDIPQLRELLEHILPQNTAFNDFEMEHEFPSIGRKTMLLNARRIHQDGDHTQLILLAIEDITERKQAEEARREAETRYTSLVRNIKDHSIFMTDVEGNITSWNREAERIIGYSEEEILGRNFSIIFSPEDIEAGLPEQELRIAREQGRAEDERWHLRKNGNRFWALGIVTPRHDGAGKLEGFSKILRDITDRKIAEQLLHEQSQALREADRHKDEFLAMLAHELRNPLAPIRSGLDLLSMRGVDPETVPLMQEQVNHMVRLVDDLLDVSRILRGKVQLRKEPVPLAVVIQRALETVRPLMEAQSHEMAVSLPPLTIWLEADPVRLNQIVTNLLNNAAKYTSENGRIELSVTQEEGTAVISVRDNGIGIEPELLPHVFDIFTQADRSLDRSQGGLGIGLTLVRQLTEALGGTVQAYSEGVGKGSEFIVRLPIATRSYQQQAQDPKTGTRSSRRVLVVEDILPIAKMVGSLLAESEGHEVRLAHDGPSALQAAREFLPEIVLLDIGLPGMDGYEVAKRLRREPEGQAMLIVALTGYGQENDRRRSEEAGFDEHLLKPPSLEALQKLSTHPKLSSRVP